MHASTHRYTHTNERTNYTHIDIFPTLEAARRQEHAHLPVDFIKTAVIVSRLREGYL